MIIESRNSIRLRAILLGLRWNVDGDVSLNSVIWKNNFLPCLPLSSSRKLYLTEKLGAGGQFLCQHDILDKVRDFRFGYQVATRIHPGHEAIYSHIRD